MAPPRTAPRATCQEPRHRGSKVTANGTRTRGERRYRRYLCAPTVGASHSFTVLIEGPAAPRAAPSPVPLCDEAEHASSRVVRAGPYGRRTRRQLYRCFPANGDPTHTFTTTLPRNHVHRDGELCEICEERRGIHHGQTAVARQHVWPTHIVADGLEKLSSGGRYGEVSKWALAAVDVSVHKPRRASPQLLPLAPGATIGAHPRSVDIPVDLRRKPPRGKAEKSRRPSIGTRLSRNAWHIAADWTEAFAPVIFGPIETRLRSQALAERARLDSAVLTGDYIDRPQVILIDDVPIYGRDEETDAARKDAGFFLLVVAEVVWHEPGPTDPVGVPIAEQKIRLIRAMAKANTPAWRLVFDELGYTPDFVIGDSATAIVSAVGAHFGNRTRFVPSLWHVARAIREGLMETPGVAVATPKGKRLDRDLSSHLGELARDGAAIASPEAWVRWWDELDRILVRLDLPRDHALRRRALYEAQILRVLPALVANPAVPMSTGGLERLIQQHVNPVLATRRAQFANIERTNALFDLVVARLHGAFVHRSKVIALLRKDAEAHGGWTVALRTVADPHPKGGRYSSLRDPTLLASVARERGLV